MSRWDEICLCCDGLGGLETRLFIDDWNGRKYEILLSAKPASWKNACNSFFLPRLISILQAHEKLFLIWTLNQFLFSSFSVCGPPAVPVNAKVQTKTSDGLIEARYDCDSGYELFGPATIRCDPHKGWEKELPFCGKHSINPQSRGFDILDAHQNGNLQDTTNKTLLSIAWLRSRLIRSRPFRNPFTSNKSSKHSFHWIPIRDQSCLNEKICILGHNGCENLDVETSKNWCRAGKVSKCFHVSFANYWFQSIRKELN